MSVLGAGALAGAVGGLAMSRPGAAAGQGDHDNGQPTIDPQFGYSGAESDEIPGPLEPDATVELHIDEEKIEDSNLPELSVESGAFHFDPIGLRVEPGDIVEFRFVTPEHTVTAFHPDLGRQQRVPDGVPAVSSPVLGGAPTDEEDGSFWLYRFDVKGVYDLFCAPHEFGGMVMRVVVAGSEDAELGEVVRAQGRPPLPLAAAYIGSGLPPDDPDLGHSDLAPEHIVDEGTVDHDDLKIDLDVTITAPSAL